MKVPHVYVIAEAGVNHNGSLQIAKKLIDAAVLAGADAIKFQSFKTDEVVTAAAPKAEYQKANTGSKESQRDMIRKLELNEVQHRELLRYANECGIDFLSAPFDLPSVDLLIKKLKLKRIKVPSGEIINLPLLLKISQSKLPIILSTGMSTLSEVEQALGVIAFGFTQRASTLPTRAGFKKAFRSLEGKRILKNKVILLQCTTEYPTPYSEINLRVMNTMRKRFNLQVGLSDHSQGISVPIAAVAQGAIMIEKHLTLSNKMVGPDHKASLEPHEFCAMVKGVREVELAMGSHLKSPTPSEIKNKAIARKSLVAARCIKSGQIICASDLKAKRSGKGISPVFYWDILGQRAIRDFGMDELIVIRKLK